MSEQDVEMIRRCFELIAAGDADSLGDLIPEDAELRSAVAGGATGVVYRGARGARQYFADLAEAWERFDQTPEQFVDLGDDGVLVIFRIDARAKTSGIQLTERMAAHYTLKDGKPWRGVGYQDVEEARRAVGLA